MLVVVFRFVLRARADRHLMYAMPVPEHRELCSQCSCAGLKASVVSSSTLFESIWRLERRSMLCALQYACPGSSILYQA
jgi:hypothetical protein